jgi:hypothetical protein
MDARLFGFRLGDIDSKVPAKGPSSDFMPCE